MTFCLWYSSAIKLHWAELLLKENDIYIAIGRIALFATLPWHKFSNFVSLKYISTFISTGCPDGLDPMQTANEIGEKGIVMYMVGCEPSITPYRDWFMAIAHITNGQYVPLANSTLLAKVIIGGAQEEIALQRLLEEVNQEVQREAQAQGGGDRIDEEELTHRVHAKFAGRGKGLLLL